VAVAGRCGSSWGAFRASWPIAWREGDPKSNKCWKGIESRAEECPNFVGVCLELGGVSHRVADGCFPGRSCRRDQQGCGSDFKKMGMTLAHRMPNTKKGDCRGHVTNSTMDIHRAHPSNGLANVPRPLWICTARTQRGSIGWSLADWSPLPAVNHPRPCVAPFRVFLPQNGLDWDAAGRLTCTLPVPATSINMACDNHHSRTRPQRVGVPSTGDKEIIKPN